MFRKRNRLLRGCGCALFLFGVCAAVQAQPGIQALVEALSSDEPEVRQAAYQGAGEYGPDAAGPVAPLLDDPRPAVRRAARHALEQIVSEVLEQPFRRAAAANSLCQAAMVVKNHDWLLHLLSYAGLPDNLQTLTWLLGDRPESTDGILRAMVRIAGTLDRAHWPRGLDLAQSLLGHMRHTGGVRRIAFINALGALRLEAAVPELIGEVRRGGDTAVAAMGALGAIGDRRAEGVLREALLGPQPAAALSAWLKLAEQQPSDEALPLYRALLDLSAPAATAADEGARRVESQPAVLCAALEGLGKTATSKSDIQRMAGYLGVDQAEVRVAAREALIALSADRADRVLRRMAGQAEAGVRSDLLEVLAVRDPEAARQTLEDALASETAEVRSTAMRLLGEMDAPEFLEVFLKAAREEEGAVRDTGVSAYLNQATRALARGEGTRALDMYHTGLELARRGRERVTALAGMAVVASPKSLEVLEAHRGQSGIALHVQRCELAIAAKLQAERPDTARALCERILNAGLDRNLCNRAADRLRAMGVEVDAAARGGFVTHWQLIGPFDMPDFAASYPPEEEYRPEAVYEGKNGEAVSWQPLHIADVMGVATLDNLLAPKNDAIAYARAEVIVPEAADILVKAGSDDMIAIWVNGEKVHHNDVKRGVTIDEDVKPAQLRAGTNAILLKLGNAGGDWQFCLRLTGRRGEPLDFEN